MSRPLKSSDLAEITRLDASGWDVGTLDDLRWLTNLRVVNLGHNRLLHVVDNGILYTGDGDSGTDDQLPGDGAQDGLMRNFVTRDTDPDNARFGRGSLYFSGDPSQGLNTVVLPGTQALGASFTLAAFVKTTKENDRVRSFTSFDGAGAVQPGELLFSFNPSKTLSNGSVGSEFDFRIGSQFFYAQSPVNFADGDYHHIAATYDDGMVAIYLDGVHLTSQRLGSGPVHLVRDLQFGEDSAGGFNEQFVGNADDILIVRRAISHEDVIQLASQGAERFFNIGRAATTNPIRVE